MYNSMQASLKKLRTEYIDILYVHWWDYNTSVEEVMDGHLVLVAVVLSVQLAVEYIFRPVIASSTIIIPYSHPSPTRGRAATPQH